MTHLLPPLGLLVVLAGCVRENPDARLDAPNGVELSDRAAVLGLDCRQTSADLEAARDERQDTEARLSSYRLAIAAASDAASRIEDAFSRDPDLLYGVEGETLRARLERCQSQSSRLGLELQTFERVAQYPSSAPIVETPAVHRALAKAPTRTSKSRGTRHVRHSAALADASDVR